LYKKTTLDNGLRIVTSAMPHTHSVSICFFIGAGSRYETEEQAGVSHFTEHMLFKGTSQRPTPRDISEAIEGVGGIINAGTDKELTAYWCQVAKPHFNLGLEVLMDMLLHSKFEPEEIEKERQVIIEEINMSKDSPSQRVATLIDELLWPNHPLGRDTAGGVESVSAMAREQLLHYLTHYYQPDNMVVAIAGDIEHREVVNAIGKALREWSNQQPHSRYAAYTEQPNPRLRIETRDMEQVHLCLALPGISLFHPQRFTLDMLNIILGEGMSSRLFTEVRDKLGLAYSIHSYTEHFLDSGSVTISAGVEPKNLRVAVTAILEQLRGLNEPIPQAELSRAKEFSKGRLLLRMEDSRGVAVWMGAQEMLTRRMLTVDDIVAIIDAITVEELRLVAGETLIGSNLRLAAVGPVDSNEPLDELLEL